MHLRLRRYPAGWGLLTIVAWQVLTASWVYGQAQPLPEATASTTPAPAAESSTDSGPAVVESSVGYIDSAIPASQFRLRFDAAYDNRRPTRAEFFYPKGGATGRGLPVPESNVDYQELTSYLEWAFTPRFSSFVESPYRFINPEINRNANGFGDLNAGFKYAFVSREDLVASVQLRTYAPTGDGSRGLGTDHVSLEPGLLVFQRVSEQLHIESELRYWIPIGGTDFAGDIIRYGIGVSYGEHRANNWWLTPVAEVVGWTVLNGKESLRSAAGTAIVEDATGQTIVNVKLGLRLGFGNRASIYTGYGRALTGDTWYKDIYRLEFRLLF